VTDRQLDDIFAAGGALSGVLQDYAPRAPQREMARAVARALDHPGG
jgi:Rad3-related DNA helicase